MAERKLCPFDNRNCMCQFCEITQVSQIHRYSAFLKRCDDIRYIKSIIT